MPHYTPLITTIVAALTLAWVFAAIAHRVKLPPLVGYLLAGIVIGPFTPGYVADQNLAGQLAEIGVILLMFGVGLHFSLEELLSVREIAIPGAIGADRLRDAARHGAGGLARLGASAPGLVFGLALSVASTVVLLRALQERRLVETERGRIAVGWLIVEDIAMVLALVLLPVVAGLLQGEGADPTLSAHRGGARADRRQDRRLRRRHADRRQAGDPVDPALHGAYRHRASCSVSRCW